MCVWKANMPGNRKHILAVLSIIIVIIILTVLTRIVMI